ncbi:MAG: TetR/AcrR family transcriptional regulator [Pseudomonadales bacterium]
MADVAEITGVSEATGYRYFENVEALLTAVGVRHFQTVNREIREASQVADGDNRDPVRRTVEANVRIHRRHADLHRLFTGEMSTHLASMRTSQPRFDYEGSAYAHVAASLTTYDFRDDEERLRVARLVFDLCESTTHSVIVDHMVDMTDEELIDQITTAIHAVLHPYQSA